MIQKQTRLKVIDNTGAKEIMCINVLGGNKKRYATLGEIIIATVKAAIPHSMVKKGDIVRAVIVRVRKEHRRKDGTYIRFDDNAAVILDKQTKGPKGSRIFSAVCRELREKGYMKIISMAPEVL